MTRLESFLQASFAVSILALAFGCAGTIGTPTPPARDCTVHPDDGVGQAAGFDSIGAIAIDKMDRIHVAQQNKLRRVALDGTTTTLALDIDLPAAGRIAVSDEGLLYAIDYARQRILKITKDGRTSVFAGAEHNDASPEVTPWIDGKEEAARFSNPQDLCVDANGHVYVADTSNQRIKKIVPDGTVTTIAGWG